MVSEYKQAYRMIETRENQRTWSHIDQFYFTLVAICLKLEGEFMCLTASLHLNVKQCREYMQEGERKVEATGSTRFHITLWNKVASDRTSWNIDGLIHSVLAKSPTVSHFCDSDTQIHFLYYYNTEVWRIIHWWIVYAKLLLCWSTPCVITLLSETPTNSHCWAIPNPNTLLRHTLPYYIAKQIRKSTHGWAIPNHNTLFRYTQLDYIAEVNRNSLQCRAIPNPNTLLRYTLSSYNANQFLISVHCWAIPNPNTKFRYTLLYYIAEVSRNSLNCWAIPNPNSMLRYSQH